MGRSRSRLLWGAALHLWRGTQAAAPSLRALAGRPAPEWLLTHVATPATSRLSSTFQRSLSAVPVATGDADADDDSRPLEEAALSEVTVKALRSRGITRLFPIQAACLAPALEGRDIVARAKTGSGKTLAFAIPILEKLLKERPPGRQSPGDAPRCLVLCPTRELASQVEREIEQSAPHTRCVTVYGGAATGPQVAALRRGSDLVVGTPGRVMDLVERGALNLRECGFLVLDESDMMLDMGFRDDMDWILQRMPSEGRQTMLFSATLPAWVRRLATTYLRSPTTVDLVGEEGAGRVADGVTVLAAPVPPGEKRSLLPDLISVYAPRGKAVVFCQTKREADEVAAAVAGTHPSEALHGDISQSGREKALGAFRSGQARVLVATDVAARGLDIPHVDLVVHYDLPGDQETFLHRSGRTGRAGNKGTAIVMYTPRERGAVARLMRETGTPYATVGAPDPARVVAATAEDLRQRLSDAPAEVAALFRAEAEAAVRAMGAEEAMSRALASMSGLRELPRVRSLLGMQPGHVTLRLEGRGAGRSVGAVAGWLRRRGHNSAADVLGRVHLVSDDVALVDMPEAQAAAVAAAEAAGEGGVTVTRPTELGADEVSLDGRDGRGGRPWEERERGGYGGERRFGGAGGRGGFGGRGGGSSAFGDRRKGGFGSRGGFGSGPKSEGAFGKPEGGRWGARVTPFGREREQGWGAWGEARGRQGGFSGRGNRGYESE